MSSARRGLISASNVYIDRALAGGLGQGRASLTCRARGKLGAPSQGYQLPLTPGAALSRRYRSGLMRIATETYGKSFDLIDQQQRARTCSLPCPPASSSSTMVYRRGVFWSTIYQTVMEGMFLGPRSTEATATRRAGVFLAFPAPSRSIARMSRGFRDKKFTNHPVGIADMS